MYKQRHRHRKAQSKSWDQLGVAGARLEEEERVLWSVSVGWEWERQVKRGLQRRRQGLEPRGRP